MSSLPVLYANNPTTIPAKTYDRVWIEEIIIRAPDPNGDVNGEVKLHKYGVFDGAAELDPNGGNWIRLENLLSLSETDIDLQNAMNSLTTYIAKIGQDQSIIAT
jgi:hypothetical protein